MVELLIVLVVMAVVLAAVMQLYVKAQTTFINQNAEADLQEDVRNPLAWLGRDIRSAVGVAASWGGFASSSSVLVLRIPSIAADGTLVDPEASFDYAIYRVANGKLQRTFDALASARTDSSRYLGDNIAGFTAAYLNDAGAALASGFGDAASVRIGLSVSLRGSGRTLGEQTGTTFKLRNRPAPTGGVS
jgi:Tfp pilus assembly protein PilW